MKLAELFQTLIGRRPKRNLRVYHSPAYRPPLSGLEGNTSIEPRRADHAAWFLVHSGAVATGSLRTPQPISYQDLARVHDPLYLESLQRPETLASIFAVDPSDVVPEELLRMVRLACGGTLEAAQAALDERAACLNLLGGFHHAAPGRGAGFCAANDIAVAIAVVRARGFTGRVAIIDLDAHPPDGTALCAGVLGEHWLGSISGSDWGPIPGADEIRLLEGTGDEAYLEELAARRRG
jgi:acetoin utilization deacetylase AcuC-like enzyme